jgi:cytochrome bd-type quinol oxidase subunit 2
MMPRIFAFGFFSLIFVLVLALVFAFWIWMLVDALMRKKFEDKLVWVLVIIFLHIIGALLYYFLVYSKKKR